MNQLKIALTNCPLWTSDTPNYSTALLSACLRKEGFDVAVPELEANFYNHVDDEEKKLWLPVNGAAWDNPNITNVRALYEKYKEGFFIPFLKKLLDAGVNVIGFHVNFRAVEMTRLFVETAKQTAPDIHIILGGPVSFSAPQVLSGIPGVDAVCLGEGEISLVSYLKALEKGPHPEEYKGFIIRTRDGRLTDGGLSPVVEDLDSLPYPDYSGYDPNLYITKDYVPTSISRGCIQRCSYCAESPYFGKFRSRSGGSIFDEVRHHIESLKLEKINLLFNDSLINGNIPELERFAEKAIESGLNISFGGMAIARREMSPELLKKLKAAGCVNLSFGVESGSQEVLHMMHKRLHTPGSSSRVLADTKEAGISTTVFIIVGFPGETERHFYETLEFLRKNMDNIDHLLVNPMLILKGSFIERHQEKFGLDLEKKFGGDFSTTDGSNNFEIRKMRQKILYLLFQEKMFLLEGVNDGAYDPVSSLRKQLAEKQEMREITAMKPGPVTLKNLGEKIKEKGFIGSIRSATAITRRKLGDIIHG